MIIIKTWANFNFLNFLLIFTEIIKVITKNFHVIFHEIYDLNNVKKYIYFTFMRF